MARQFALGAAMSLALCVGLMPATALAAEESEEEALVVGQAEESAYDEESVDGGVEAYADDTIPVVFGGDESKGEVKGFGESDPVFTFTVPKEGKVKVTCSWFYEEFPFSVTIENAAGDTIRRAILEFPMENVRNNTWTYMDVLPKGDYSISVSNIGYENDFGIGASFWVKVGWAEESSGSSNGANTSTSAGWVQSGSKWWYRNADGSYPASCWKQIDGSWYLFDGSGYMRTGWAQVDGSWYYLKGSGAMATGWQQVGGSWYYLKGSGAMATGWYTVDGEWNWSDSNGVWHANRWAKDSNGWWYAWADGTYPRSSWQLIDGDWYHFDGSGYMQTGWLSTGGSWYYLAGSGAMQTGWQKVDGSWYYLDASRGGAMSTDWYQVGGSWYYSNGSGVMQSNRWVGNYWLTGSGAMATSSWVDGGRYYVGADGVWVPNYSQQPSKPEQPSKPNQPSAPEQPSKPNQPSNPGSSDTTMQANYKIEGNWTIRALSTTGTLVPVTDSTSIIFVAVAGGTVGMEYTSNGHQYFGTWSFEKNTSDGASDYLVKFQDGTTWYGRVAVTNGEETLYLVSLDDNDHTMVFGLHSRK